MRTVDVGVIRKAVEPYLHEIVGLDIEDWVSNPNNVALVNEKEDVVLFEHQAYLKNTVSAHYFFVSRGKQAVETGQQFLKEIFSDKYKVEQVMGLTPLDNKGALWMNKRLGAKEIDTVDTEVGPCRFVLVTKQDWKIINE